MRQLHAHGEGVVAVRTKEASACRGVGGTRHSGQAAGPLTRPLLNGSALGRTCTAPPRPAASGMEPSPYLFEIFHFLSVSSMSTLSAVDIFKAERHHLQSERNPESASKPADHLTRTEQSTWFCFLASQANNLSQDEDLQRARGGQIRGMSWLVWNRPQEVGAGAAAWEPSRGEATLQVQVPLEGRAGLPADVRHVWALDQASWRNPGSPRPSAHSGTLQRLYHQPEAVPAKGQRAVFQSAGESHSLETGYNRPWHLWGPCSLLLLCPQYRACKMWCASCLSSGARGSIRAHLHCEARVRGVVPTHQQAPPKERAGRRFAALAARPLPTAAWHSFAIFLTSLSSSHWAFAQECDRAPPLTQSHQRRSHAAWLHTSCRSSEGVPAAGGGHHTHAPQQRCPRTSRTTAPCGLALGPS